MEFNSDFKVISQEKISNGAAFEIIKSFQEENPDLDGIFKIQINEFLEILRKTIDVSEDD